MQGLSIGLRETGHMPAYEQTTRGIRVRALPMFLPDQSNPEERRFLWSYTITIENHGGETVQLIARYWKITDENGRMQEVRGPGVVGAQPVLEPGEEFEYTSWCMIATPDGSMRGSYQMLTPDGDRFDAEVAPFKLAQSTLLN